MLILWGQVHRQQSMSPSSWECKTLHRQREEIQKPYVFKEPLNFQQVQGIRDKKENKVRRECRAERYLLLHQLVVCQRKQQKWGLEFARLHIRGGLPIPCLFSSEKLPCEEKHSFYYLWGQPLLFIMLMLLCYMPSAGPLFHREVFLCTEGEKERKHSNPPLPVCRIGEEIKVRVKEVFLQSCDFA